MTQLALCPTSPPERRSWGSFPTQLQLSELCCNLKVQSVFNASCKTVGFKRSSVREIHSMLLRRYLFSIKYRWQVRLG